LFQKCWMSLGSCMLVMSYGVVLFDCVSFSVYSELNKIKKRQLKEFGCS
jgi:hypothetical protein